jgi:hypothetical protein
LNSIGSLVSEEKVFAKVWRTQFDGKNSAVHFTKTRKSTEFNLNDYWINPWSHFVSIGNEWPVKPLVLCCLTLCFVSHLLCLFLVDYHYSDIDGPTSIMNISTVDFLVFVKCTAEFLPSNCVRHTFAKTFSSETNEPMAKRRKAHKYKQWFPKYYTEN